MAVLMAGIVLTVLGVGVLTVMLQRGPVDLPQLLKFCRNAVERSD